MDMMSVNWSKSCRVGQWACYRYRARKYHLEIGMVDTLAIKFTDTRWKLDLDLLSCAVDIDLETA